jgi:hypothetical protein
VFVNSPFEKYLSSLFSPVKKRNNIFRMASLQTHINTAGNRHKQNSWFCKEIREDNFRCWWRRVHEDASQGMYMSKITTLVVIGADCTVSCKSNHHTITTTTALSKQGLSTKGIRKYFGSHNFVSYIIRYRKSQVIVELLYFCMYIYHI